MFEKILLVTDFSPNSLKVMPPVLALASAFRSKIYLCHVDEEEQALSPQGSDAIVEFFQEVEQRRSTWLETLANQVREQEIDCDIVRLKGYASKMILAYADEEGIDVTAISALGTQGFKALLMGSTATNVLRHSTRPLLFISAACHPRDRFEIHNILYPTDFSPVSVEGARFAARLARELSAKLELFHVMKIPAFIPALPGEPPLAMPPSFVENLNQRFSQLLDELAQEIPVENVSWELTIGQDEADEIAAEAIAKKIDIIVMPKRGQSVLEGLLFGRTAENVAKTAPVPTLLFTPEEVK